MIPLIFVVFFVSLSSVCASSLSSLPDVVHDIDSNHSSPVTKLNFVALGLPSGTYLDSCASCSLSSSSNILSCNCKNPSSSYDSTSLALDGCDLTESIDNAEGTLICKSKYELPPGTYGGSCAYCYVDVNGYLSCACSPAQKGANRIRSSIRLLSCNIRSDISNNDGRLSCDRLTPSYYSSLPCYGTYLATCDPCSMNGNQLSCSCTRSAGGWRVSSLDINTCDVSWGLVNSDGTVQCRRIGSSTTTTTPTTTAFPRSTTTTTNTPTPYLPSGNYASSCTSCSVSSYGVLSCASCDRGNGMSSSASLSLSGCDLRYSVDNDNGNLVCTSKYELPLGSYRNGCNRCMVDENRRLSCSCMTKTSTPIRTSLLLTSCDLHQDISVNDYGQLICAIQSNNNIMSLPYGTYWSNCVSCSVNFGSYQLSCQCSTSTNTASTKPTSLDLSKCDLSWGVKTSDGNLQCRDAGDVSGASSRLYSSITAFVIIFSLIVAAI